tara:strand:- start:201 stop:899 length:699 start_codon:yes stop_codon:yes gene_type:complete
MFEIITSLFDFQIFMLILSMFAVDYLSAYVTRRYNSRLPITPNTRWFFLHSYVNFIITITTFSDLVRCLIDPYNGILTFSETSQIGYRIATISHVYHMVFFYNKLTQDEWLHHVLMCLVCGPLTKFYNRNRICVSTLWFLSGLPGFIDYAMLYLVKIGRIPSITQKNLYIYLSCLVRSPGCIIMVYIQLLTIHQVKHFDELLARLTLAALVLWNAQYFLYITIRDTTRKFIL